MLFIAAVNEKASLFWYRFTTYWEKKEKKKREHLHRNMIFEKSQYDTRALFIVTLLIVNEVWSLYSEQPVR